MFLASLSALLLSFRDPIGWPYFNPPTIESLMSRITSLSGISYSYPLAGRSPAGYKLLMQKSSIYGYVRFFSSLNVDGRTNGSIVGVFGRGSVRSYALRLRSPNYESIASYDCPFSPICLLPRNIYSFSFLFPSRFSRIVVLDAKPLHNRHRRFMCSSSVKATSILG